MSRRSTSRAFNGTINVSFINITSYNILQQQRPVPTPRHAVFSFLISALLNFLELQYQGNVELESRFTQLSRAGMGLFGSILSACLAYVLSQNSVSFVLCLLYALFSNREVSGKNYEVKVWEEACVEPFYEYSKNSSSFGEDSHLQPRTQVSEIKENFAYDVNESKVYKSMEEGETESHSQIKKDLKNSLVLGVTSPSEALARPCGLEEDNGGNNEFISNSLHGLESLDLNVVDESLISDCDDVEESKEEVANSMVNLADPIEGTGAFCSGGDQALRNKDGYADYENIGRPNVPDVQVNVVGEGKSCFPSCVYCSIKQVLTDYMKTRYPFDPVCSATGKTTISAPAKAPTSRGHTPPPPP
ncbi:hypothetical protein Vadar_032331 [Vaccinium darrowii]|uniref:Uncharacterized protein n=1 Tax=Vaccinium darrowii TaxID=229202 RepID=A0ACB7ZGW5_9ERIC|nr:hypothetical protein Vadar_032331 [Vaccinium darrowii]